MKPAPEGTWTQGGGIELPCKYKLYGDIIKKEDCKKYSKTGNKIVRDNFVILNIGNSLNIFFSLLREVHMGVYAGGRIFGWAYFRTITVYKNTNICKTQLLVYRYGD